MEESADFWGKVLTRGCRCCNFVEKDCENIGDFAEKDCEEMKIFPIFVPK